MLRILYVHGLDSSPNWDRINYLQKLGHQVSALHLDYRNEPQTYEILKNKTTEENINYLVGSSLGGFLSFWLGEELGIPSLLFNPAMYVSPAEAGFAPPGNRLATFRRVVIGAQDDVVDPRENWNFFEAVENQIEDQRVVMCQWLGHQIDVQTFKDSCHWAGLHHL